MFRLAVFAFALLVVSGQKATKRQAYNGDPQVAAILQEQRYQSGDGTFGAAYQQEDGIDFKEESDAAGNRKGSYSYVDPSGQRRTVHYTAGKNGFQATGDHLPQAPAGPAPVAPQPQYNPPPQQYNNAPQQQYNPPPQQASRSFAANPNEDDGQYHPELYERENYVAPEPQRSFNAIPQQEYRPQYRAPAQPQAQSIYPGVQQAQYSGVQSEQYRAPAPVQHAQYSGVQSEQYRAPAAAVQQPRYYDATTPAPHRFFPPGKFNLDRSPDGYSYTFSKQ